MHETGEPDRSRTCNAPASKSDRERVIPMSAELFHTIAQIIRRHRGEHGTVPVCQRYDRHERVWSEDLPYLFQTVQGGTQRAMSATTIAKLVRQAANDLIPQHPEFSDVKFSPQDFRRLFATELVNNGLPIHIGATLLGHLNIKTTRGYVAVFAEDAISQYQQFLACRRAERPASEYREPTPEEWQEFQEHFDKCRVELGSCGRPYGTRAPTSTPAYPNYSVGRPVGRIGTVQPESAGAGRINLASADRTDHILRGEQRADGSWSGEHQWPGNPGKSVFPESWSADDIMEHISDVAADPGARWEGGGSGGGVLTRKGTPARFRVFGERDGVCIRAVVEPVGEGIITSFPDPGAC